MNPDQMQRQHRGRRMIGATFCSGIGNSMAVPVVSWILERMRISMEAHP